MKLTGKILIVDDDHVTLEFFDIMLGKLGYDVIKAVDGIDALDKIKLYEPDLILLDNIMPKLTGFELIQILKKEREYTKYKNTPIIMFSAMNDPRDKVLGLEMGIEDYIAKPFNFSEVLARIRNVIRHKELSAQLLKRERRLAILESLNTNLIAFLRHIRKPLSDLKIIADDVDLTNSDDVKKFIDQYGLAYNEAEAMITSLEDEILEIEKKGNKLKEEELTLEELEKRINKRLDSLKVSEVNG